MGVAEMSVAMVSDGTAPIYTEGTHHCQAHGCMCCDITLP